jgi:hypothetical protein
MVRRFKSKKVSQKMSESSSQKMVRKFKSKKGKSKNVRKFKLEMVRKFKLEMVRKFKSKKGKSKNVRKFKSKKNHEKRCTGIEPAPLSLEAICAIQLRQHLHMWADT